MPNPQNRVQVTRGDTRRVDIFNLVYKLVVDDETVQKNSGGTYQLGNPNGAGRLDQFDHGARCERQPGARLRRQSAHRRDRRHHRLQCRQQPRAERGPHQPDHERARVRGDAGARGRPVRGRDLCGGPRRCRGGRSADYDVERQHRLPHRRRTARGGRRRADRQLSGRRRRRRAGDADLRKVKDPMSSPTATPRRAGSGLEPDHILADPAHGKAKPATGVLPISAPAATPAARRRRCRRGRVRRRTGCNLNMLVNIVVLAGQDAESDGLACCSGTSTRPRRPTSSASA